MGDYKPQVGDRVRVTFERTVVDPDSHDAGCICTTPDTIKLDYLVGMTSVEKAEPPVEVFGPGDVVRPKRGGAVRVLAQKGYFNIALGEFFRYDRLRDAEYGPDDFTSERFERVTLS